MNGSGGAPFGGRWRLDDARQRLADLEEAVFGPPPPVIQGRAEPVPRQAGDGLVGLEGSVFSAPTGRSAAKPSATERSTA